MWIEKAWQTLQKCFREGNFEKVEVETVTSPQPLTETPPVEDTRSEQEIFEDGLLALAKKKEAALLERKDELIKEYQEEYDLHFSKTIVSSARIGNFISVYIQRPNKEGYQQEAAVCVHIPTCGPIVFEKGHPPDFEGVISYYSVQCYDRAPDPAEVVKRPNDYESRAYRVEAFYPSLPSYRKLMEVPDWGKNGVQNCASPRLFSGNYHSNLSYDTEDFPRPARDDRICFKGCETTLYLPAGRGEEFLKYILSLTEENHVNKV